MNKEKVFAWIESLEDMADQSDRYFVERTELYRENQEKDKENERLKEIAHKMHLWIFLHSGDEQKVYDELELTDEENAMLGYSGQFRIGEDKDE